MWVFPVAVVLLHLLAAKALDAWPRLRDPEYGFRAEQLRKRVAEHPQRPLVLVLGSSRVSMGVRPAVWEQSRPGTPADPLVFNMSVYGGGPVTQLLMLRRVYADGFRPTVVLLEYWPPVLRQDDRGDLARFDRHRLGRDDRAVIRAYHPDPASVERWMRTARLNVLAENRTGLMVQADPRWLPVRAQTSGAWAELDPWGWVPGMDPRDAATRAKLTEHMRVNYAPQLTGCAIHADSDRAFREAVALARANGAQVGFVYLPESSEFRGRYPAGLDRTARAHLAALSRELAVPVIDARDWMSDDDLADGFHLSRDGAAAFTAKLGPAIAGAFPPSGGTP